MKKIVLLALSAWLFATSAWPQVLVPMTPGQHMKGQALASLGQLAQGILALANRNRELDVEVVTARAAFFANAKTPPSPAVAKRFAEALHKRDLHYVLFDIMNSASAGPILKLSVDIAGSDEVDGGRSPYCFVAFRGWSNQLVSNLTALGSLEQALDRTMPEFEAYRVQRDLAEALFFNPHGVLRAENPNPQEYLAAWMLGTQVDKTVNAANASAARIAAQVGSARLAQIVGVLRDWTTVTAQLEGPWEVARQVLDPLVSGTPNPPHPADWTAQARVFSELRGRLLDPRVKLAGSLDEVKQLWDSGRQARNLATLYQAAARRDALVQEIEDASLRDLAFRYSDNGLTKSMTELNLQFIDRGIRAIEIDMMGRGEKNARGELVAAERRNYLAWNSKLIPRSVQAPPERPVVKVAMPAASPAPQAQTPPAGERRTRRGGGESAAAPVPAAAPAVSSGGNAGSGPALPDPNADGVGPFDRAIILVQDSGAVHISPTHLSDLLHIYAKNWDAVFNHKPREGSRELGLTRIIDDTQLLVRDIRQNVENRNTSFNMMPPQQRNDPQRRREHEANVAPLNAIADELDARIADMRILVKQPE
jgi:hypothetical protein